MKNSSQIKFVYFDIGGVILHFKHQFDALEKTHNISKDKSRKIWSRYIDSLMVGKYEQSEIWNIVCKETDCAHLLGLDWAKFRAHVAKPIQATHDLIWNLQKLGIGFGLLSNAEKGMISLHLSSGRIPNANFNHIVDSSHIGMKKPDAEIFAYAQSLLMDVPKSEVLFIDDMEENCAAARMFGWQAVLFDEENPDQSVVAISKLLNI